MNFEQNTRGTSRPQGRHELAINLKDIIDTSLYQTVIDSDEKMRPKHEVFSSNQDFWRRLLTGISYETQKVQLKDFYVMEWVPLSPGLYFTPDAAQKRREAMRFIADMKREKGNTFIELSPNGKLGMVQGGLGSLKLTSKIISGANYFILCATSSGRSHEGVPILLSEEMYSRMIDIIKRQGSVKCTLTGKLKAIPAEMSTIKLQFEQGIPRYVLLVDDISSTSAAPWEDVLVSIAINYAKSFFEDQNYYSFCTFYPDPSNNNLKDSVAWLQDYAVRYSKAKKPVILADFDETQEHFEKVEFPIAQVAKGKVSMTLLKKFSQQLHFEVHENIYGDTFTNISDSKIINRSTLKRIKTVKQKPRVKKTKVAEQKPRVKKVKTTKRKPRKS